jgi:hypothetical protein
MKRLVHLLMKKRKGNSYHLKHIHSGINDNEQL